MLTSDMISQALLGQNDVNNLKHSHLHQLNVQSLDIGFVARTCKYRNTDAIDDQAFI